MVNINTSTMKMREITFELTNSCNLRCRICNIWKEPKKKNLFLKDIQKVMKLADSPCSVSLTGGEPFLNPQIDKIYRYLFRLHLQKKITGIDIATNAYSKKIIDFLSFNRNFLGPLSLSISIDGLMKLHNSQRSKKDAFKRTITHISIIKKYNIPITLKFVISRINYQDLFKVYAFAKKIGAAFNLKFFEKIPNYYHRHGDIAKLNPSRKQLVKIEKIIDKIYEFERHNNKTLTRFSLSAIKKLLKSGNLDFVKRCLTPKRSLFITSSGKIHNCLYQNAVGDVKRLIKLDLKRCIRIIRRAEIGKCPKCLSYHGYLREFNAKRN